MQYSLDVEVWLNDHTGLLHYMAEKFHLLYEDVRQEAAVTILSIIRKRGPFAYDPTGYFIRALQMHFTEMVKEILPTVSLDEPFSDKNIGTLGDLLPMPTPTTEEDHYRTDRRAQILHDALHKLPLEEQLYLCQVHKLTAYTTTSGPRMPRYNRPKNSICICAYRRLRTDEQLRACLES
jgi:hypothetical protein